VQPKSAKPASSPPPKAAGKGTSLALKKPAASKKDNFSSASARFSGPVRFVLVVKNRLLQRNQCPGSRFNIPYRKD
jgi:hypothetical protein